MTTHELWIADIIHKRRLTNFSIERLMQFLTSFDQGIEIVAKPVNHPGHFRATVAAAAFDDTALFHNRARSLRSRRQCRRTSSQSIEKCE